MTKAEISSLSFDYKAAEVLDDLSFSVGESEIVAILGPNGAGKSTLIRCINRILKYKKGTILIEGDDLKRLAPRDIAKRIGYVSQNTEPARLTVFDAILLGRHPHVRYREKKEDLIMVSSIIEKLSLKHLSLRYLDQLSGGELQKVSIARALVQQPELLLLDEPTSSLDLKNQIEVLKMMRDVVDGHGVSAVMSLHDINLAIHYTDRILFLKDKKIYRICSRMEITEDIIKEVYGIDVSIHYTDDYPIVVPAQY